MTGNYGRQMSGEWLKHWMKELIKKGTGDGIADLKTAYNNKTPMLAAVVRVSLKEGDSWIRVAALIYTPPDSIGKFGRK